MDKKYYSTGADPSPYDLRTFTYKPTTASKKGGSRYLAKDIEDQHRVGICTAISLTMNARKALGVKFSADFQYLCQKKFVDGNWEEGSSARSALKVGTKIGFLKAKDWKWTTEDDRKLPYSKYIKKLQDIPDKEIERLKGLIVHKLTGYAQVPVDRDLLANAIDESKSGIITRFVLGNEWYREPIEPLRPPKKILSGHLVSISNYDGISFRIPNSWGDDWADKGTAYFLLNQYAPTEAWIPYYEDSKLIEDQKAQLLTLQGKLKTLLQMLVVYYQNKLK